MAVEYRRKSGQIPAFGDWETANELPITQYFECARQAGLLRCSCSQCASYDMAGYRGGGDGYGGNPYASYDEKPRFQAVYAVPPRKTRESNRHRTNIKDQRKQVKVRDIMEQNQNRPLPQKKHHAKKHSDKSEDYIVQPRTIVVKPVDEDLYKVPAEFLDNSKRKKVLGFFSKCIVPPCAA